MINRWKKQEDGSILYSYNDYKSYIHNQISKQKNRLVAWGRKNNSIRVTQDLKFRLVLLDRILRNFKVPSDKKVLCLGARSGDEVITFKFLGYKTFGVDLFPGPNNPHVIKADFHYLPFNNNSMDIIFTNSMDHLYDIDKFFSELTRMLKVGGTFITECIYTEDMGPGFWESYWWKSITSIRKIIEAHNLQLIHSEEIEYPWRGTHMEFRLNGS